MHGLLYAGRLGCVWRVGERQAMVGRFVEVCRTQSQCKEEQSDTAELRGGIGVRALRRRDSFKGYLKI